jgi:hypothetical protein
LSDTSFQVFTASRICNMGVLLFHLLTFTARVNH